MRLVTCSNHWRNELPIWARLAMMEINIMFNEVEDWYRPSDRHIVVRVNGLNYDIWKV